MKFPQARILTVLSVLLFICCSLCSPMQSQEKALPYMTSDVKEVSGKSFDYIIVGGGTAGCPLAATLSEKFSVLLVERGGSPFENPLIMDKNLCGLSYLQTDEYTSVAQSFVSEDGIPNFRGRVLGGSSAINGGFYSRASEDFVKQVGWDEKLVKEAYEWVESRVVFTPELTPWQTVAKSSFLEAGILPDNGVSLEHIEGTKIGGTIFDGRGKRHTSAELLKAGNPKNITVLLSATVKNVIFCSNGNTTEKVVRGIRFIKSYGTSQQTYKAYLNKPNNPNSSSGDVILSAGALGSPQILLLSGIGSYAHLRNFDLPLVAELKGVGRGMKDNPAIVFFLDSKPQKRQLDTPQVVGIADDFKIIIEAEIFAISFNATRVVIGAKLAFPLSQGKLKLNSKDPRQNPSVKFNYLAKEEDSNGCVRVVELLSRVEKSQLIARFLGTQYKQNNLTTTSKGEVRKFCKRNVKTFYHYHGGCIVGEVVDKDYRVHGVKGLRVVDGSTFPESPGTNSMATVLMLGRYQGIKILQERKKLSKLCPRI